jgi:hypothetical protein
VSVIKRQTKTVQSKPREEFSVRLSEKVLKPSVEEEFVFLWSEDSSHGSTMLGFLARESCDKVLHAFEIVSLYV